jgi:lysophospholipase L1-like esterase
MPERLASDTVFLFQGDSITDGARGRSEDKNHILGHGYVFLVAAQLGAQFAEQRPVFHNRGVSGNRVVDVYARWEEDTLALEPDVLSILVGINGCPTPSRGSRAIAADKFEKVYRLMLEEARARNPDLELILLDPFVLPVGARRDHWPDWEREVRIRRELVDDLAAEFAAAHVECQAVFDAALGRAPAEYWLWDGVHPTWAGHQLLADAWLRAFPRV